MIRTVWVWLNGLVATAVLSVVVLVCALFGAGGDTYDGIGRAWARWILNVSGVKVKLEGLEHVAADRPQIVVSNHASWYDVWALAAFIPGRYHFVAKKELAAIPLFGHAWRAAGHISIDRSDTASAVRSLREAGERLRAENGTVVIFPEGTRSDAEGMLPFKKGAFMLAITTGVEIVPTAVIGGRRILAKGGWRVRPGTLIVRFGEPIASAAFGERNRDELIRTVRASMDRMLTAPTSNGTTTNV